MAEISELTGDAIRKLCGENAEAIAESLNGCFNSTHAVSVGEAVAWSADALSEAFNGPGLISTLRVGGQAMLALVPETLPIPGWWRTPDKSQASRLQTLPMEWAFNLLPPDYETDSTSTFAVENIGQAVAATSPTDGAQILPLILGEDAAADVSPRILLVWPVAEPMTLHEFDLFSAPAAPTAETGGSAEPAEAAATAAPVAEPKRIRPEELANDIRLRRLLKVPVSVTVRIAEKKVNLQNVLMLTPGALLTFNKSCESLLDLYVNNCHYGQGEAVKIGEKFGLKLTDVGVRPE